MLLRAPFFIYCGNVKKKSKIFASKPLKKQLRIPIPGYNTNMYGILGDLYGFSNISSKNKEVFASMITKTIILKNGFNLIYWLIKTGFQKQWKLLIWKEYHSGFKIMNLVGFFIFFFKYGVYYNNI